MILSLLCIAQCEGDDDGPTKPDKFISPSIRGVKKESQADIDRCKRHEEKYGNAAHKHQNLVKKIIYAIEIIHSLPPNLRNRVPGTPGTL
jgi:hypothetical protein